jgi:hypothetical protein
MTIYDPNCTLCPRLAAFLDEGKRKFPAYWCGPVAPFGDAEVALLIVGLAPGFHGANATGRTFTGDRGCSTKPVCLSAGRPSPCLSRPTTICGSSAAHLEIRQMRAARQQALPLKCDLQSLPGRRNL